MPCGCRAEVTERFYQNPFPSANERAAAKMLSQLPLEETAPAGAVSQASGTVKDPGVDAIVAGTLENVKHHRTMVNVRLVQVPSGALLTEMSASIKRTWY